MSWDNYTTLNNYLKELSKLIASDEWDNRSRFRMLQEAHYIRNVIKRYDKILKIEVVGDWEFSHLAQGKDFSRFFRATKHLEELHERKVERWLSDWEKIKNDPVRLEKRKAYKREYDRMRRERNKID